jgi:hypothetical protein
METQQFEGTYEQQQEADSNLSDLLAGLKQKERGYSFSSYSIKFSEQTRSSEGETYGR